MGGINKWNYECELMHGTGRVSRYPWDGVKI